MQFLADRYKDSNDAGKHLKNEDEFSDKRQSLKNTNKLGKEFKNLNSFKKFSNDHGEFGETAHKVRFKEGFSKNFNLNKDYEHNDPSSEKKLLP